MHHGPLPKEWPVAGEVCFADTTQVAHADVVCPSGTVSRVVFCCAGRAVSGAVASLHNPGQKGYNKENKELEQEEEEEEKEEDEEEK